MRLGRIATYGVAAAVATGAGAIALTGACGFDPPPKPSSRGLTGRGKHTVKTGGAPLSSDPFKVGYCYYDHVTPTGVQVGPVEINATFDATGTTFTTDAIPRLNVPIFLNGDPNDVIVLPIRQVVLYK